jgi:hypothetical protein
MTGRVPSTPTIASALAVDEVLETAVQRLERDGPELRLVDAQAERVGLLDEAQGKTNAAESSGSAEA